MIQAIIQEKSVGYCLFHSVKITDYISEQESFNSRHNIIISRYFN